MRILHYFLGFPPYRSGGLTRFAYDLMREQAANGHQVSAVWPGRMTVGGVRFRHRRIDTIESYELINPLPVPIDEGICEPERFMRSADSSVYFSLLEQVRPEVIHLHTIMGLHREFLAAAHEQGIRIIFTTHDYFGLCFKTNLYQFGHTCDGDCTDCVSCNRSGLSIRKIRVLQSAAYRMSKDRSLVKKLRKRHRNSYYEDMKLADAGTMDVEKADQNRYADENFAQKLASYEALRAYYRDILRLVDCFHFNSSVARDTYLARLAAAGITPQHKVIPISHKNLTRGKAQETMTDDGSPIRLTYLGPLKQEKGFFFLERALIGVTNMELRSFPEGYEYAELENILRESELVIVPSLWRETYGFTVLEALMNRVPVLLSDTVGAGDILGDCGAVFESGNVQSLRDLLCSVDRAQLAVWSHNIERRTDLPDWKQMVHEIEAIYD